MRMQDIVLPTPVLAAVALTGALAAQAFQGLSRSTGLNEVITPQLSEFIQGALGKAAIPGLSLGIVQLDHSRDRQPLVELAAWGRKTEEAEDDDLTADTLFALASCSKAFLTTSIGLLIDDYAHGRNTTPLPVGVPELVWDTKVQDLLPDEFGMQDEWTESRLSLRDAFSHVSGLPRHDYSYRPGETTADVLQRLRLLPPAYELREQWMYNNQMYMVGAHLVSKLTSMSYGSFVESRIFVPLGMTASTFSPSKAARSGKLTQTWTRGARRIPFWFPDEVAELFAGPGGVISSAEDMTKWIAVLLNGGVDPMTNKTIIPSSVYAETTTAHTIVSGVGTADLSIMGYGMGWFRMSYRGHDVVWHSGAIPGFSLLVAFLPHDNLGVVMLTNIDEKLDDTLNILYRVIDEALGLAPKPAPHDTSEPSPSALQENIVEPLPLTVDAYAGAYHDAAYGSITLCAPTSPSQSEHCTRILDDFSSLGPLSNTTLYAAWPRVWSTHMRLQHARGASFAVTAPAIFSKGYGRNTTAFEFYDSQNSVGRAEFVMQDGEVVGFALIMEEQAARARMERAERTGAGGGAREVGDGWFERADSDAHASQIASNAEP